ncbi:putative holin-like toxin [Paucisalibacillus sp. EB02]|uniref:putative holin-like toxin n=1 Tax=Paucisalibacillus sp. EB02 TaxID=1347087 RepID=UPI00350F8BD4
MFVFLVMLCYNRGQDNVPIGVLAYKLGVMPLRIYEVMMVLGNFGTLLLSLLALVLTMINKN